MKEWLCHSFYMTKFGENLNNDVAKISLSLPKGSKILDLGCGVGGNSLYLSGRGFNVTCVDKISEFISEIKQKDQKINAINKNLIDFELAENKYDLILAINVLQFFNLSEAKILFKKIINSLKEEGVLYLEILSVDDSFYEKSLGRGGSAEDDSQVVFNKKINSNIRFYKKEELLNILSDYKILDFKHEEVWEEHEPFGRHKHASYIVTAKKH